MKFFRGKFHRIWNFKIPSVAAKQIYPPINHQTADRPQNRNGLRRWNLSNASSNSIHGTASPWRVHFGSGATVAALY
nr:hypothetical protein [uncultured Campylobacter sp.]